MDNLRHTGESPRRPKHTKTLLAYLDEQSSLVDSTQGNEK